MSNLTSGSKSPSIVKKNCANKFNRIIEAFSFFFIAHNWKILPPFHKLSFYRDTGKNENNRQLSMEKVRLF